MDGYTLTLAANPWNIVRTYNLTPGRELPARHGLQLRGVHVRGRQRLRPIVRQLRGRRGRLEHGQDVLHRALLKGREYNQNKAVEGFDEVNNSRTPRAVHQSGYADVLLRPTMVGILRCGKMLPPQLNLVIEIEFADATTALWSENAGAHPAGATLSTDFEIQNVRVLASHRCADSCRGSHRSSNLSCRRCEGCCSFCQAPQVPKGSAHALRG